MLPPPVVMDGDRLIVTNASASWKTKVLTKKMECNESDWVGVDWQFQLNC